MFLIQYGRHVSSLTRQIVFYVFQQCKYAKGIYLVRIDTYRRKRNLPCKNWYIQYINTYKAHVHVLHAFKVNYMLQGYKIYVLHVSRQIDFYVLQHLQCTFTVEESTVPAPGTVPTPGSVPTPGNVPTPGSVPTPGTVPVPASHPSATGQPSSCSLEQLDNLRDDIASLVTAQVVAHLSTVVTDVVSASQAAIIDEIKVSARY